MVQMQAHLNQAQEMANGRIVAGLHVTNECVALIEKPDARQSPRHQARLQTTEAEIHNLRAVTKQQHWNALHLYLHRLPSTKLTDGYRYTDTILAGYLRTEADRSAKTAIKNLFCS